MWLLHDPYYLSDAVELRKAWLEHVHDEGITLCKRCDFVAASLPDGHCEACNEKLHEFAQDAERDLPFTASDFDDGPIDECF